MRRWLVVPAALAFTLVATAAGTIASCDRSSGCERLYCIQADPPGDGGVDGAQVMCPQCSDDEGRCPAGCEPIG